MSGPQLNGPRSTGLTNLGQCWSLITSCSRSQKTVPEFKNSLQLIWSALLEKAIDNFVNDYSASDCRYTVSANGGYFEHLM